MHPEEQLGRSWYPSTHWSAVGRAATGTGDAAVVALSRLLQQYRLALLAHVEAKFQVGKEAAEDFFQGFVLEKVLEKELLAQARPERGRFRTFLLNSLDRFVISKLRYQGARKRSSGSEMISLDAVPETLEPADPAPGSDRSDVLWAQTVVADAIRRMQAECEGNGRLDIWGVFQERILDPILDGAPPVEYERLIERFGFTSPAQAFNTLNTAKRSFARHLRAVVSEYAKDPKEVEDEMRELRAILARSTC